MKSDFEAVLFDFDGTLADTGEGIGKCADYACEYFKKPRLNDEQRKAFVGPPLYDSFRMLLGLTSDEDIKTAIAKYRECYVAGAMFDLKLYDGMEELLREIHESGIKTVIASSKPEKFVKQIIEKLGLSEYFTLLSCPTDDNIKRSKYELISSALKKLNVNKDKAIMVGDRYLDIEGASQAGIKSIGAAYGYGTAEELLESGADFIAFSVSDVRKAVFLKEYR